MSDKVKAMQQAIVQEKAATALDCTEVIFEVLADYNCKLVAVPTFVEISPGIYATAHSWKVTALDD